MAGTRRFEDLEKRFSELESKLSPSPEKEALSVLHAMIHENRRMRAAGRETTEAASRNGGGISLDYIANLYKTAPPMEGNAENRGLPVGTSAPAFSLPDASGRVVTLDSLGDKNILLVFYPLDWSPACSDQLSLYQGELEEFNRYNTQVVGISVDSIYSHGAWAAVRGLSFPLLSDFNPKGEVARRYQVYRPGDGFSERALYLLDRSNVIRYAHVSPQLHMVPNIYELFEQLRLLSPSVQGAPTL